MKNKENQHRADCCRGGAHAPLRCYCLCTCGAEDVIGYDPGTPDGDKSAIIYGKRGKNGTVEVVCVRMGKPEPRRTVFDSLLKRIRNGERLVISKPRAMGLTAMREALKDSEH